LAIVNTDARPTPFPLSAGRFRFPFAEDPGRNRQPPYPRCRMGRDYPETEDERYANGDAVIFSRRQT
jgi:hypothetical protein